MPKAYLLQCERTPFAKCLCGNGLADGPRQIFRHLCRVALLNIALININLVYLAFLAYFCQKKTLRPFAVATDALGFRLSSVIHTKIFTNDNKYSKHTGQYP